GLSHLSRRSKTPPRRWRRAASAVSPADYRSCRHLSKEPFMERIEKSIEVKCPVRAVYNQWTQFEEFPRVMAGVKEVTQLDDTHLHWHAEIWGKEKEWDAEIT